jgi:hypothetical protein
MYFAEHRGWRIAPPASITYIFLIARSNYATYVNFFRSAFEVAAERTTFGITTFF